jgi:hypothetical protein
MIFGSSAVSLHHAFAPLHATPALCRQVGSGIGKGVRANLVANMIGNAGNNIGLRTGQIIPHKPEIARRSTAYVKSWPTFDRQLLQE